MTAESNGPGQTFGLMDVVVDGETARVQPPAKLNLYLEVIGKRTDGFHDIETLMTPIELRDTLEVTPSPSGADNFEVVGEKVPRGEDNLVLRTLELVRTVREIPPLSIRLEKQIPAGSGLGGGSSDAAGMLAVIERLFPIAGGEEQQRQLAPLIGSDVPFFLGAGPAMARGRGEILSSVTEEFLGGDRPAWLLVIPEERVDTSSCYRQIPFPLTCPNGPITFPTRTFETCGGWRRGLFNRLWQVVEAHHPALSALGRQLEKVVPDRWSMSGSGSTFFVVCESWGEAEELCSAAGGMFHGVETPPLKMQAVRPWSH